MTKYQIELGGVKIEKEIKELPRDVFLKQAILGISETDQIANIIYVEIVNMALTNPALVTIDSLNSLIVSIIDRDGEVEKSSQTNSVLEEINQKLQDKLTGLMSD